jgi:hypothetical protein
VLPLQIEDGTLIIGFGGGIFGHSGFLNGLQFRRITPADTDQDGMVNVDDLLAVILDWGSCSEECPADVNGDGQVNVDDLVIVLTAWG